MAGGVLASVGACRVRFLRTHCACSVCVCVRASVGVHCMFTPACAGTCASASALCEKLCACKHAHASGYQICKQLEMHGRLAKGPSWRICKHAGMLRLLPAAPLHTAWYATVGAEAAGLLLHSVSSCYTPSARPCRTGIPTLHTARARASRLQKAPWACDGAHLGWRSGALPQQRPPPPQGRLHRPGLRLRALAPTALCPCRAAAAPQHAPPPG